MRKIASICAIAALLSGPLSAAEDYRIQTGIQRDSSRSTGMGAQASVRIKFGDQKTKRNADDVAFTLAAGPSFARTSGEGFVTRRGVSGLASFTVRPGYSAKLSMAGQPLVQHYTARGLAEAQSKQPQGRRNGVSTLGWVGIGVGVIVVAIGSLLLVCTNGVNCVNSD